jgi:hypothetical protein
VAIEGAVRMHRVRWIGLWRTDSDRKACDRTKTKKAREDMLNVRTKSSMTERD